jgi:hypothetical protein
MSVDTVRFYQTRGLLPQPEREGRVVFYLVRSTRLTRPFWPWWSDPGTRRAKDRA